MSSSNDGEGQVFPGGVNYTSNFELLASGTWPEIKHEPLVTHKLDNRTQLTDPAKRQLARFLYASFIYRTKIKSFQFEKIKILY
jgi:hypothetical protein